LGRLVAAWIVFVVCAAAPGAADEVESDGGQRFFEAGVPVELRADSLEYEAGRDLYVASGGVRIRQTDRELRADWMAFSNSTRQGVASGDVVYTDGTDTVYTEFAEFEATDGQTYCWGYNRDSQLGVDSLEASATPLPVSGNLPFVALSSGAYHTCGVTASGDAYCWGRGASGQLGNGSTDETVTPSLVLGGLEFETVSAGSTHSCGLTTAGTAWCWGNNDNGELGDGTVTSSAVPVRVVGQP